MKKNDLVRRIEQALTSEISMTAIARSIAKVLNMDVGLALTRQRASKADQRAERPTSAHMPGTAGPRVVYVAQAGKAKARESISHRAGQVMAFVERHKDATAKKLQAALRVNRNVIAGAVHELKQAGLLRSEERVTNGGGRMIESAAEYQPRQRKTSKKAKTSRDRAKR